MLTIILWLDPGPLSRPSTATWLDTLPVDSSSINRRVTVSPWITRAGGGPERGAPVQYQGGVFPLACLALRIPSSPQRARAKGNGSGRRAFVPRCLRSNESGKARGEVARSAGYRGIPTPPPLASPLPPPPGEGVCADRWGSRRQGARGWGSAWPPARGEGPRGPGSPLTRTPPAAAAATRRWRPRPAQVTWLQVTRCRARPRAESGPAVPRRPVPGGPGALLPGSAQGPGPGRAWGAGLGDWFGGGRRLGGPGYPRGCSPAGPGAGTGVLGLGRGGEGEQIASFRVGLGSAFSLFIYF